MENQRPNSSDEIDLSQLFSKIGDFFKNMGLGFMRFFALLRRIPLENKFLFIVLIIASIIVGFSYSKFVRKKFYESSMILSSDYLNKRLVDNTVEKLNLLAEEENKHGLAKVLNISDTLAGNIVEFKAKPFIAEKDLIELEVLKEQLKNAQANAKNEKVIEQVVKRIDIENRHAFEITVKTYNPTFIGALQSALVNHFKNNDYIKKRIEINKANLLEKKTKLFRDLQKLDSLKFIIFDNYKSMAAQSRQGSNNVILSDKAVTDPVEIYTQDLSLYNQFQDVNERIYLQKDFEVIDGFTEFSEPSSASLRKIISISILIGIGVAYLTVALSAFDRYLASFK
ncbi:MAG TPA: hypothetical protein VGQ59_16865 [Cyclobacteriaceae bacterium]|nr:hypothetical protein [Cyclobacteriaceae bacterium]